MGGGHLLPFPYLAGPGGNAAALPCPPAGFFKREVRVMGMEPKKELQLEMSNRRQRCGVCSGTGLVRYPDNQDSEYEDPCPICDGKGWLPEKEDVAPDGPATFISESNSD